MISELLKTAIIRCVKFVVQLSDRTEPRVHAHVALWVAIHPSRYFNRSLRPSTTIPGLSRERLVNDLDMSLQRRAWSAGTIGGDPVRAAVAITKPLTKFQLMLQRRAQNTLFPQAKEVSSASQYCCFTPPFHAVCGPFRNPALHLLIFVLCVHGFFRCIGLSGRMDRNVKRRLNGCWNA